MVFVRLQLRQMQVPEIGSRLTDRSFFAWESMYSRDKDPAAEELAIQEFARPKPSRCKILQ